MWMLMQIVFITHVALYFEFDYSCVKAAINWTEAHEIAINTCISRMFAYPYNIDEYMPSVHETLLQTAWWWYEKKCFWSSFES